MDMAKKRWIDSAPLDALLELWRFGTMGSPWFKGELGEYFRQKLSKLQEADPVEWTAASKRVGWDKR